MFVVWGSKEKRKKQGYCANYCQVCREISVMELTDLYKVSHLYYIPLGSGKLVASELSCTACNKLGFLDPNQSIKCNKDCKDLDSLIGDVPEDVLESWNTRIEEDKLLKENPSTLDPATRTKRILETFLSLEDSLSIDIQQGPKVDRTTLPGCIGFIGFTFLMFYFGEEIMQSSLGKYFKSEMGLDGFGIGMLFFLGMGLFMLVWFFGTHKKRLFKHIIYPHLAKNLAYLKPSHNELLEVKEALREGKYKMKSFKVLKLEDEMLKKMR